MPRQPSLRDQLCELEPLNPLLWERYNQEFHDALIGNCHSRWLRLFHKAMYDHSQRYRMLSLETKPFPRSQSAREHKLILDAALARDAETAVESLAQHILKGAALTGVAPGELDLLAGVDPRGTFVRD